MPRTLTPEEFAAVKQHVLDQAPSGLSQSDFERSVKPILDGAIAEAENSPAPVTGSTLGRFAAGAWSMLSPMGLVNAITSPVQTVKNMVSAQVNQGKQAIDLAKQGRYIEAAGHSAAAVLPVLGPAAARAGEQIASGDVAGGLGASAGLLAPFAVKYGLELKNAPNPQEADLVRRGAEQTVAQKVLAPGNPKFKGIAEKIAPEVLSRKLQGSRLELQQLADEGMADAADKIDAAIASQGPAANNLIDVKPIVASLDKRIQDFTVDGKVIPTAASKVAHLEQLRDYLKNDVGNTATFSDLKRIRDDFYRAADAAKGYQGPDVNVPDVGWAAREAGSAIRQQFAKDRPELVAPNADYTFYKRLGDVLDPTLGRPKNVTSVPTGVTGGLSTAGAVVGQAMSNVPILRGASALLFSRILPALKEAQNSPAWQLASASKKMAIADALDAGKIGTAQKLLVNLAASAPRKTETEATQ